MSLPEENGVGTNELALLNFPGHVDWSTTVVLKCDPSAGPYKLNDLVSALHSVVWRDQVYNLGCTAINHVFTMCMRSVKDVEVFVQRFHQVKLKVKGQPCEISEVPVVSVINVVVRWIPLEIDSVHLVKALADYGTVVKTELNRNPNKGWFHVYNNERRFTMQLKDGVNVNDLPFGMYIQGMFASVLVQERKPKCLDCHYTGHVNPLCDTKECLFNYGK